MTKLAWDQVGERVYETGVDHGVLYIPDSSGNYDDGFAWNGLTTVTESPSGAESNKQYADNIEYLNLISVEQFGATVEAFTYPDEFAQCDGSAEPSPGVRIGQQSRKSFGLCYRTRVGTDLDSDAGYKLHLVYGAQAAPSEKAYATINDSPEAITFSWDVTTTPVAVPGHKPSSSLTIDSTKVDPAELTTLENILYGTTGGSDARLPLPGEVLSIFGGSVVTVETTPPTYNAATDIITIPSTTGVVYMIGDEVVPAGPYGPITADTVVNARPADGYTFSSTSDTDWSINFA